MSIVGYGNDGGDVERIREKFWAENSLFIKLGILTNKAFSWKSKLVVIGACISRQFVIRVLSCINNLNFHNTFL